MGWSAIIGTLLTALPQFLNLVSLFAKKIQETPQENRREVLAELDAAITKARDDKDLRALSKWLGGKL
jgi:HAMP domain-containing protein